MAQPTKDLSGNTDSAEEDVLEPVAIIGLSLKFPQDATSPEALWEMLLSGVSTSTEVPPERFHSQSFYHKDPSNVGSTNVTKAHFLKGNIAAFDAPFFSITPAEAACMDPQQRWLLETAYRALENAGIPHDSVAGSMTSVHIGSFLNEYSFLIQKDTQLKATHSTTGTESGMLANRLSWFFDLRGPSMQVDTACSSSLNAVHLACQALRCRDANLGLAGGCNIFYNPEGMLSMTDLNFLSPDGHSYSFDSRANGYARGEGVGLVVLKRLSDAIREGDTIRAVIRATGSNQDGKTSVITQPNAGAQRDLILRTYAAAGLKLDQTRFFEAHGTGTPVGDPIEANAIQSAFGSYRSKCDPLWVGAIKSNIGHLEGAAGIAGLIKAVLVLEKGVIPRNIGFQNVNPQIPLQDWNIEFPLKNMLWPKAGLRRASVNSFGFGGSNSHVVLDDACNYLQSRKLSGWHCTVVHSHVESSSSLTSPRQSDRLTNGPRNECDQFATSSVPSTSQSHPKFLVLMAADEGGIDRAATALQQYITSKRISYYSSSFLQDLAYTLCEKKSRLPFKAFSIADAKSPDISQWLRNLSVPVRSAHPSPLALVFTGQGAQWWGMGRELLRYPIFAQSLSDADLYLRNLGCKWSAIDELQKDETSSNLDNPQYSQPLCTILQVALVQLLQYWGICPNAVVGHSSGEIAAAYAGGSIEIHTAWKVAYYRGVISQKLCRTTPRKQAMMSVGLSEHDAQRVVREALQDENDYLTIGCVNSHSNVTLSGYWETIKAVNEALQQAGIFSRILNVDVAYHSRCMQTAASEYLELLGEIEAGATLCEKPAIFSSVTGTEVAKDFMARAEYWVENMTHQVKFSNAITSVIESEIFRQDKTGHLSIGIVLEIGPHSALRNPIKHTIEAFPGKPQIEYKSMLIKGTSALTTSLNVAGSLFCSGYSVKLARINDPEERSPGKLLIDVPEYQFNHSQTYWTESRLSRNFRFRSLSEHELLGVPVPDWNTLDARWRKVFRLGESNWLLDHKVDGAVLFPAAGMMTIAMEGSQILSDKQRTVSALRISDMHFLKAIILSTDSSGTEVQASFRPISGKATQTSDRWDFRLYMLEAEQWSLCCQGVTGVVYNDTQNHGTEKVDLNRAWDRSVKVGVPYKASTLYKELSGIGYEYKQTFQVLRDISLDLENHEAVGSLLPEHSTANFFNDPSSTYVIHPTTLDGIFQLMIPALFEDHTSMLRSMLPARVDNFYLVKKSSEQHVNEIASSDAYVKSTFGGYRNCVFTALANTPRADLFIRGFRMVLSDTIKTASAQSPRTSLCYKVEWEPDIQLINSCDLETYCQRGDSPFVDTDYRMLQDLEPIVVSYIAKAASSGALQSKAGAEPYLQKYKAWMQSVLHDQELKSRNRSFGTARQPIVSSAMSLLVQRIGEKLAKILDGSQDPLDLLFGDNLMRDVYAEQLQNRAGAKLAEFLSLCSHKNPVMKILEVGAGTGATTRLALKALTQGGVKQRDVPRFASYTFTDISTTFIEASREIFQGLEHRAVFGSLNLEYSPTDQGFEAGQYDLIIAAGTLHATRNISRTVGHMRQILKPNGKIVLYELTQPTSILNTFIWGVLPSWWLSEEMWRSRSPLLSPDQWNDVLQSSGFSGVDTHWLDHQDPMLRSNSVLVSTASLAVPSTCSQFWSVSVVASATNVSSIVAQDLMQSIPRSRFSKVRIISPQEIEPQTVFDSHYIFLHELSGLHMAEMTESFFCGLQKIFGSAESVFWVTTGNASTQDPRLEIVTGLARTVQSEGYKARFSTLSLEDIKSPQRASETIMKAFSTMIMNQPNEFEQQHEERNSIIHVPRVAEYSKLSEYISQKTIAQSARLQKLRDDASRKLVLSIRTAGLLDTLEFTDDASPTKLLAPDEIEVKVEASGLIFRDVLIAAGIYDDTCFGLEFAGIVIKAGIGVQPTTVGDRVCGWSHGTFRTLVRCKAVTTVPVPESMPLTTAVSYPVTHCTAYHCLINVARLQRGEAILIHSAAGGTGQAIVQLAKHIGADIFATVGSEEKKRYLVSKYGIPEDHIFSSRDTIFKDAITRLRGGKGVEVILNSLSDELFLASLEIIAPFGRFVEIGKQESNSIPLAALSKNVVFAVVDLSQMLTAVPSLLGSLMRSVMKLVERGVFSVPEPFSLFPASQIEDAFTYMQSGKSMGKIVVSMGDNEFVHATPKTRPQCSLDPIATYLIAGAFGGIGRDICRWMTQRGARHLILLSRSGKSTSLAQQLLYELAERGIQVSAPACDITDAGRLQNVLQENSQRMPPIKGCIQAALALNDRMFDSTTLEEFNLSLRPKVQGSWNLHNALPSNLDFFIMLSSFAGIVGSPSQSSYNCGNVFQDALARYRIGCGQRAVSLDLGMVQSVGFVAENPAVETRLRKQGYGTLKEAEVLALLDYWCDPSHPLPSPDESQVITGIASGEELEAAGVSTPFWLDRPLFSLVRNRYKNEREVRRNQKDGTKPSATASVGVRALLEAATTRAEADDVACRVLVERIARTLQVPVTNIDASNPAFGYGIDSLGAVTLRHWLGKEMGADMTTVSILSVESIRELARRVVDGSVFVGAGVKGVPQDREMSGDSSVA